MSFFDTDKDLKIEIKEWTTDKDIRVSDSDWSIAIYIPEDRDMEMDMGYDHVPYQVELSRTNSYDDRRSWVLYDDVSKDGFLRLHDKTNDNDKLSYQDPNSSEKRTLGVNGITIYGPDYRPEFCDTDLGNYLGTEVYDDNKDEVIKHLNKGQKVCGKYIQILSKKEKFKGLEELNTALNNLSKALDEVLKKIQKGQRVLEREGRADLLDWKKTACTIF